MGVNLKILKNFSCIDDWKKKFWKLLYLFVFLIKSTTSQSTLLYSSLSTEFYSPPPHLNETLSSMSYVTCTSEGEKLLWKNWYKMKKGKELVLHWSVDSTCTARASHELQTKISIVIQLMQYLLSLHPSKVTDIHKK